MAKNQNTFEKRRREVEKKRKAEEKRERRRKRKVEVDDPTDNEVSVVDDGAPTSD
jgi:predicted phosphoribosyltransferase